MSLSESGARAYEEAEAQTAEAVERLIGNRGFGEPLGQLAENAAAIARSALMGWISPCAICGWPAGVLSAVSVVSSRAPRTSSNACSKRSRSCAPI
jgi:hypothetical protein